jgi:hypothetical protein
MSSITDRRKLRCKDSTQPFITRIGGLRLTGTIFGYVGMREIEKKALTSPYGKVVRDASR